MSNPNVTRLPFADASKAVRHVFIRNLELAAHIGIHGHEQGKPQPVRINVDLSVEDAAVLADRLDVVVDYAALTTRVLARVAAGLSTLAVTLASRSATVGFEYSRVRVPRVSPKH